MAYGFIRHGRKREELKTRQTWDFSTGQREFFWTVIVKLFNSVLFCDTQNTVGRQKYVNFHV